MADFLGKAGVGTESAVGIGRALEAPEALRDRRCVVMGLGSFGGGAAAARYLARAGARVVVTDTRSADVLAPTLEELADLELTTALGGHREADFDAAELVVVNPAVSPDHPLVARARRAGSRITSEIELFLHAVRARVVCVTGTEGKSSTCHLVAGLLGAAGERVHLGGNIGRSLLGTLPDIRPTDVVVLELSSYQLAALEDPAIVRERGSVHAVGVTNVRLDHLERHGTEAAYLAAKERILELLREDGVAVLPADDPRFARWRVPGRRLGFDAGGGEAELRLRAGAFHLGDQRLAAVEDLALPGEFQRANALLALGLARALGADPECLASGLREIRGLDHRLQDLGVFRGHRVLDNAVSTTPDSTVSALRSCPPGACLVLGGRRKALPFDELVRVAAERTSLVVAFGEAGPELAALLADGGCQVRALPSVEEALAVALEHAPTQAPVLFSPACSSFDAYPNFRARAAAFRAALPAPECAP